MRYGVRWSVCAVTLLLTLRVGAQTGAGVTKGVVGSFESRGKRIAIERFVPFGAPNHPAVIILHGPNGFDAPPLLGGLFTEDFYRKHAAALQKAGIEAVILHYFDATGTTKPDNPTIARNFATWLNTIADAVGYVSTLPGVSSKRIGLMGFALGASLAIYESAKDTRVRAVVSYHGSLPAALLRKVKRVPPVLILHGAQDKLVPVADARSLKRTFDSAKFDSDLRIYPAQGHGFSGADAEDAMSRATRFLTDRTK